MPAKSKAQQRAAGIALSAQRGLIPRSKLRGASKSMFSMENGELKGFAKTSLKGKPGHAPKKWWGGPLAGFAPWQSQGVSAFKGLGQMFHPKPTVAPMMPSMSGLMAPQANGWQGPMGSYADGGRPKEWGTSRADPAGMKLQSDVGLSLLPDDFYYMKGPKIKGAKPQDFIQPSPREQRQHEQNPEQFGRPVAGLLDSDVPGRTDQLPISVAAGSYVLPADVVSGFGQGNTRAGAKMFRKLLRMDEGKAEGGSIETPRESIPIVAAGGELIVPPNIVVQVGDGDEIAGHAALDKLVLNIRSQVAKRLTKLPPPRRD